MMGDLISLGVCISKRLVSSEATTYRAASIQAFAVEDEVTFYMVCEMENGK